MSKDSTQTSASAYWMGVQMTELSREELLQVIDWYMTELEKVRSDAAKYLAMPCS